MQELIKINTAVIGGENTQAVNGRDLHRELKIKRDFTNWMKAQIKRAHLKENIHFEVYALKGEKPLKGGNLKGGRPTAEYILSMDSAKHVAMMSNSKEAFAIRDYFIQTEKKWRAAKKDSTTLNIEFMINMNSVVSKLADTINSLPNLVNQLDDRLEALEKGSAQAEERFALPRKGSVAMKNRFTRKKIHDLIDSISDIENVHPKEAWIWVYECFEDTYDIDLAKASKAIGISRIDTIERIGMLKELHSVMIDFLV